MPPLTYANQLARALRRLLPKTLAWRVYELYGLSLLLFLGVGLGLFYRYQFDQHIAEENERALLVTEVIANTITESAVLGDYDTIRRTLDRTIAKSRLKSAIFIDVKGAVLEASAARPVSFHAPQWLVARIQAELYDINHNISAGGHDYGVLRLTFAAPLVASHLWQITMVAVGVGVVCFLLGMLLLLYPLMNWLGALDQAMQYDVERSGFPHDPPDSAPTHIPVEFQKTLGVLKRTAASLQSQRLQATITLTSIHDGVLTLDSSGSVLLANPAAQSILGMEDLIGKPVFNIVPGPENSGDWADGWRSRRRVMQHPLHGARVVETSLSVISAMLVDAQANYVFVVRDVTAAQALEQQLHQQLTLQAKALKTLRRALERLNHSIDPDHIDTSSLASDDIETVSTLLSELIQARESDRRALDNQKFALDQHAIVCVTNPEGLIEYANDRLCRISGYSREELWGTLLTRLSAPQHALLLHDQIQKTLDTGLVWQGELCNRSRSGQQYWVSATLVPLKDAAGHPQQFIAIQTDISALKAAEVELQKAKNLAEAANRAKSEFLANMSHEIRTPMNGIIGMTDLALDTALDAQQREFLSIARSSAESLLSILNDILDFSKIEAGHLNMECIAFDVRACLRAALDILGFKAREKSLNLSCNIAPEVPTVLMGDPGRLRQIVSNLVVNAIKFTFHGEVRVVVVVLEHHDDRVRLKVSVQDTGIGIAPEKQHRLFNPFSQVDASTTREFGGTGLGLTICKRLAQLMHGETGVESVQGQGSIFWFTCELGLPEAKSLTKQTVMSATPHPTPLAAPSSLAATSASGAPATAVTGASSSAAQRVLLVDDNIVNQKLATHLLRRLGYATSSASNGMEALELLRTEDFDLVVMDCQMPEMDGYEATAHIRAADSTVRNRRIPVIALTANAMEGDRHKVLAAGMDDYLTKPIQLTALSETLTRWLPTPDAGNTSENSGPVGDQGLPT